MSTPEGFSLANHFLIAMPGLDDSTFARSVVYMCEHSERGALGLIINKPGSISMADLFDRVDLPLARSDLLQQPVFQGGPVQTERGFVLHDPMQTPAAEPQEEESEAAEAGYASTLRVPGGLDMTTSRDVLEALSGGGGPRRAVVMLGYSAWDEGQLESEIARNSWLTVDADAQLIFEAPVRQRYERALDLLGLQPWRLVSGAGHA